MKLLQTTKTIINTLRGSLFGATKKHYQNRALDTNRSKGHRPYEHLSDQEVKNKYVRAIGRVRDSDSGGLHLSPIIDRGWNLQEEWTARGNDMEELNTALRHAGYEVKSR